MPRSNNDSNGTAKTSERIFPARTLVKSPQMDVDNPFNRIYKKRSDMLATVHAPQEPPISTQDNAYDEGISPGNALDDGNHFDLDGSDASEESHSKLTKTFNELDRVKDNQGTVKVDDIASTQPLENEVEEASEFRTQRFTYKEDADGSHKVLTGLADYKIQACEDEPIHIPGAVQSFGVLITLRQVDKRYEVVHISENSGDILGLSPKYMFGLQNFMDILPEKDQAIFADQLEFLEESNSSDFAINAENTSTLEAEGNVSPEVFLMSGQQEDKSLPLWNCWTAVHRTVVNGDLILVEFERQSDDVNPLVKTVSSDKKSPETSRPDQTPERGIAVKEKSGMQGEGFGAFSEEDLHNSTVSASKPLRRVKRSVLSGNVDGSMEIFSLLSQINGQLSAANSLQDFLKIVAGLVKEITEFHRVMIYQFDEQWNGQVVAEMVDWEQTKDLFQGLSFPATDIPAQARALYKVNRVRTLYDRDQPTARLVCRNKEALEVPVDMTHCFLRAMSPIHLKYLANMGVRGSMSISITAFGELWGLIACHSYGETAMRCSFLTRKLCRLMGEQISHNIERLSYAARLTARKLIHTPSDHNPSGYIVSKAEDLLGLFDADIGMLSIGDEGKILGGMENSQEAIALREYFKSKRFETITPSNDLRADFPDLTYAPGFKTIAGVMYIPLSRSGEDFLLFFRRGQLRKVHWAGNPYEKVVEKNKNHTGVLLPRQSFKVWSESVRGRCKEWGEDQVETAAVLCLVYGKFIEVWREKQQVAQTSKLTSLLLNNAGHEVRTPLNAVINYLEIAMEGDLPHEVRESLEKSHTASKSLVYVINDLLDLTKSEQGHDLFRHEPFDLVSTVREAVSMYRSQADRHDVNFTLEEDPDVPRRVIGDQAKIRQVVGNVTANALKYTKKGSVRVETKVLEMDTEAVQVAIIVTDTGCGISEERLDAIFSNFELVEAPSALESQDGGQEEYGTGLGLAIVARVVRNMNGQLKAVSKIGRGSTFTFVFHFPIPEEQLRKSSLGGSSHGSVSTARKTSKTPAFPDTMKLSTDTQSEQSDTSGVEVDPVSGQRIWPSHEKHQVATRRAMLQRRSSAESKDSHLKQQIQEIRQLSSDNNDSDIDHIMNSMINTKLPSSGSVPSVVPREGSGRSHGSRHGTLDASSIGRAGSIADNNSLYTGKNKDHKEEFEFENRHYRSNSAIENSALDKVSEETQPSISTLPDTLANTRSNLQHMRGVKLDAQEVTVPSRYSQNATGGNSLSPGQGSKQIASAAPQNPAIKPLNILVAEDDAINRSIIQKRLQIDKHKIKLAFHGADCYEEYAKDTNKYDVILMDMQMPVLDGMGASRKIRELEHKAGKRNGRVPIIAVSASLLESQAAEAIEAGIDGWILKPVNFIRLREFFQGLQDGERRKVDLYSTDMDNVWEKGGWFTGLDQEAVQED